MSDTGSGTVEQPGWVYHDPASDLVVYRASSLGSCTRSLVAARLGETAFPFNAGIRAAMDASSGLEEVCVRRFVQERNGEVIWQQKEVELRVHYGMHQTPAIIRGHIDGLSTADDTILEIKALGMANFEKYNTGGLAALGNLGRKYAMQAAVYGHATGRDVRFVIGEKVRIITDPTDGVPDHWAIEQLIIEPAVTPESLVPLADIHARIALIEDFASRDELPDCDQNCREGDPYSEVHLFDTVEKGDDELLALIIRREKLKETLGAEGKDGKPGWGLLGELADVQDAIKTDYGHPTETRKYTVGNYTVTIVANKGQERVDTRWLRKNYPDIAAEATKITSPYQTLIVKGQQRDDDNES